MKAHSYLFMIVILILALLGIAGAGYFAITERPAPEVVINSFDECQKAGMPVFMTDPEECRTPDGRTFTAPEATTTATLVTPPAPTVNPEVETAVASVTPPTVTSPSAHAKVKSPLTVTGSAAGPWYFEASFPIILNDADGHTLAEASAKALGDWMSTGTVPFSATLTFATTTATSGTLILKKDNPSGMPEHDAQLSIPVNF